MILDAANIARLGDDWVYLESHSGNNQAYNWLVEQYPNKNIEKVNFYQGVHIDSTIVPLRQGLAICQKSKSKKQTLSSTMHEGLGNHLGRRCCCKCILSISLC